MVVFLAAAAMLVIAAVASFLTGGPAHAEALRSEQPPSGTGPLPDDGPAPAASLAPAARAAGDRQ